MAGEEHYISSKIVVGVHVQCHYTERRMVPGSGFVWSLLLWAQLWRRNVVKSWNKLKVPLSGGWGEIHDEVVDVHQE